jgi:uncharacterized protein YceK
MRSSWVCKGLCLLTVLFLLALSGCSTVNTPERVRRRSYTIRTDIDHMVDDIDWALGLHRPSKAYNVLMR